MTRESFDSIVEDCEKLSPFLLHMLYKALMVCIKIKHNPPADLDITLYIQGLKLALERFRSRWLVAGMFKRAFPCCINFVRKTPYKVTGTYLLLAKRYEVFSLIQTR